MISEALTNLNEKMKLNRKKIIFGLLIFSFLVSISFLFFQKRVETTEACPYSYEEDEEGNKKALEIFYPQVCQLTTPDLEEKDKNDDEVFDSCWELKKIYDALPHFINTLQKMIETTVDPEEGCDLDRCDPQCVDATCYAKDFHCNEGCVHCSCSGEDCSVGSASCDCSDCPGCECEPECVGHCSEHHTAYGSNLPCKSDIINFYDDNGTFNGDFRVCPDLTLGHQLVQHYYLIIEKAQEKIEEILCPCQGEANAQEIKKRAKEIKEKSEEIRDLSQELKAMTDKCLCSKKSLCEVDGCSCSAKGCCPLSQCSQADIEAIKKKTEEIEKAIKELIEIAKDDYEHKYEYREYIK
jgi:hypothetical protein